MCKILARSLPRRSLFAKSNVLSLPVFQQFSFPREEKLGSQAPQYILLFSARKIIVKTIMKQITNNKAGASCLVLSRQIWVFSRDKLTVDQQCCRKLVRKYHVHAQQTVGPRGLVPFFMVTTIQNGSSLLGRILCVQYLQYSHYLFRMDQDFLDIQYTSIY